MERLLKVLSSIVVGMVMSWQACADDCGMQFAFQRPDGGKTIPVWKGSASGPLCLLFRNELQVNTDGTRESYSVEDFWGTNYALNNLCNAMAGSCNELLSRDPDKAKRTIETEENLRNRRIITQEALKAGWPAAALRATRIDDQIIVFKKNGRPCPEISYYDGAEKRNYLVSATALSKPVITNVCDPNNYLDAITVPALVLPEGVLPTGKRIRLPTEFDYANAKVGDLVVAITPSSLAPVYAVVGDLGPTNKLGEGSIALNSRLKGITRKVSNYHDLNKHLVVADATILIFPGTRSAQPYLATDRIDNDAAAAFKKWGGGSIDVAMRKLEACSLAIKKY